MNFNLKSQPMFSSARLSARSTLLALLLGAASVLFGQAEQGTIAGIIKDASGAVGGSRRAHGSSCWTLGCK